MEIELEQNYAVIEDFPEEAVDLAIDAEVYLDGKIQKVRSNMNMAELAEAIKETKDGYLPGITQMSFEEADNYVPVENCIVLSLPVSAVSVLLTAKTYGENGLETYRKHLDIKAIREAFRMAEDDYIPSDAVFVATEKGKELAENILSS